MHTYLSIGHSLVGKYEAWIIKRDSDNIEIANHHADFLHDLNEDYDFKGRIDHDKMLISLTGSSDDERLKYVVSVFKVTHPEYKIKKFTYGKVIDVT